MGLCGTILLFFLLLSPDASHQPLISPAEVAVLESMMEGGRQLNLKAHFLTQLPDLCPLTTTLTYLNVSFNDLRVSRFIRYMAGYLMHDKLVYCVFSLKFGIHCHRIRIFTTNGEKGL